MFCAEMVAVVTNGFVDIAYTVPKLVKSPDMLRTGDCPKSMTVVPLWTTSTGAAGLAGLAEVDPVPVSGGGAENESAKDRNYDAARPECLHCQFLRLHEKTPI